VANKKYEKYEIQINCRNAWSGIDRNFSGAGALRGIKANSSKSG